jgi:chromosome segregation protein
MYLSRLTVTGFKSYTEPVTVDFDEKISVIIGSNGVGKSNALDAIVWGLGEDDAFSLRCGSREDLLFAGSGITEPADEARVELTYDDNGQMFTVWRSITRTGSEQYVAAGQPLVDLEQYRSALDDLRVGAARRNIIRQDQLADLFFRSPQDRKAFFENYASLDTRLDEVNELFEQYIEVLIPGSQGRVVIGPNGQGVDVEVVFPDKGLKRGVLLSGGERASTALALKLALFGMHPSPTYMLDEVEPALDWTHNHNMQELLKTLSENRQIIMVTHFQSTIRMAKTVHGVRIRPDGSSWLKFHFLMDERLFKIYKCC